MKLKYLGRFKREGTLTGYRTPKNGDVLHIYEEEREELVYAIAYGRAELDRLERWWLNSETLRDYFELYGEDLIKLVND